MGEEGTRRRVLVGSRAEMTDGTQRIVSVDGAIEVGVIAHGGEFSRTQTVVAIKAGRCAKVL